jgi:hypothetical protein
MTVLEISLAAQPVLDVRRTSMLMAAPTPIAATPKNTRSKRMTVLEISLAAQASAVRAQHKQADGGADADADDTEEHQVEEHDRARDQVGRASQCWTCAAQAG